jgi:hypothetical protein
MAMEEATAAMVAAEEPVAMTTALDAVAMAGPDDSGGGCPDVVRSDTWGAPDTTLDPKAMGKTHVSMIGSGGSRPPPLTSTFTALGGISHIYCRFFLVLFSLFVQVF